MSAGDVISQDPAGGTTVLYRDLVSLVISSGPCPAAVTVPNVSDLSQDAASLAITAAGLVVGQVTEQCSDTVPEGSVISQNPVSGVQAAPGSAVNLVISSGVCEQPIPVPDVTGLAQAAAQAAVTAAGLTVVTPGLSICSDTVPAGQVITQFPAAGTQVTPGSQVLLVVSSGPCDTGGEVQNVTVPNVVGQTQSAAESALTLANLNLGVVANSCSDAVPAGSVISQAPAAGVSVPPGTVVSLVVSSGACTPSGPVTVPNVVDKPESAALLLLTDSGLNVGSQLYVFSNSKNPNTVLRQLPAAGQSVARGSAVDLVVSRGLNLDPPSNRDIMKQLYDRLSELDGNGDGLSLEEAVAQEGLPGLAIEVFELVDKDGDGFITEEEFVEYLGIGGCFGCVKRLFVKDMLVSAGGDLLLAGLGLAMLSAVALRRKH
ncbi:MAG TPA: PASTA domain-containing protein [Candidatus Hydrogenedentes bacterium]|nr:PASTA domain-containing protein [Candidatus Hydrogenedentota bacterium]